MSVNLMVQDADEEDSDADEDDDDEVIEVPFLRDCLISNLQVLTYLNLIVALNETIFCCPLTKC